MQDGYLVCRSGYSYSTNEWMAHEIDIRFRMALSCERGTLLRKGIVQLQTKVRAKTASRASLAIRLVTPENCPDQLLRTVW